MPGTCVVLASTQILKRKYDQKLPTEVRVSRKLKLLLIVTGPTRRYFNIVFICGYSGSFNEEMHASRNLD